MEFRRLAMLELRTFRKGSYEFRGAIDTGEHAMFATNQVLIANCSRLYGRINARGPPWEIENASVCDH